MTNKMLDDCVEMQKERITRNEHKAGFYSYNVFTAFSVLNLDFKKLSDILVGLPLVDLSNKKEVADIIKKIKEQAADVANMAAVIHMVSNKIGTGGE